MSLTAALAARLPRDGIDRLGFFLFFLLAVFGLYHSFSNTDLSVFMRTLFGIAFSSPFFVTLALTLAHRPRHPCDCY
jgi:hypothetical protein